VRGGKFLSLMCSVRKWEISDQSLGENVHSANESPTTMEQPQDRSHMMDRALTSCSEASKVALLINQQAQRLANSPDDQVIEALDRLQDLLEK